MTYGQVPDLSARADFELAWKRAKRDNVALVWIERRRGGRWAALLDLFSAKEGELSTEAVQALLRLERRLAQRRTATGTMVLTVRVVVPGFRTKAEAFAVAAVLQAALADDIATVDAYE